MIWINPRGPGGAACRRPAVRGRRHALAGAVAAGLAAAGCSGPDLDLRPEIGLAQEDQAYAPAALDHAVRSFVGDGGSLLGGAGSGGAGGGGGLLDGTVAYTTRSSWETTLGLVAQRPLSPGWQVEGRLRTGQGRGRHFLPAGAGVFKDPIDIVADTRFAEAEAVLVRRIGQSLLPGDLSVAAGVGTRYVDSRLRIDSALLALDTRYRQRLDYATLGTRYHVPVMRGRAALALFAEGRSHGDDTALLRGGAALSMALPRGR
ncbi:hypothetical protein [Rhodovulum adriaticum]|uniref:Uncharacterized protein n=1 Tax=Rhodovulum adriaticum TaxID=35804 RepID=A0A4R2NYF2_RHOAD|nr:hypothetical protein [Rhodovulum adriaticum]TCP27303.1 hypothetical protein EV656_101206 [Rhodovulum adriaticum]